MTATQRPHRIVGKRIWFNALLFFTVQGLVACSSLTTESVNRGSRINLGDREVFLPGLACHQLDGTFFVLREKNSAGQIATRGTVTLRGYRYFWMNGGTMETGRFRCLPPRNVVIRRSDDTRPTWLAYHVSTPNRAVIYR